MAGLVGEGRTSSDLKITRVLHFFSSSFFFLFFIRSHFRGLAGAARVTFLNPLIRGAAVPRKRPMALPSLGINP